MYRSIKLPKELQIIEKTNYLIFKGLKGEDFLKNHKFINISIQDNLLSISSTNLQFLNLYFTRINTIIFGVCFGSNMKLRLKGLGYSFEVDESLPNYLFLNLGLSHKVCLPIPQGLWVVVKKRRSLFISGYSLVRVTTFGALIRSYKEPDVYKGKGVLKQRENVILQIGKRV